MTNFIGEYKIDDSMCDALIEHHRNSEKISGKVGYKSVDKSQKDSKDVHVNIYTNKLIKDYINEIRSLARRYCETYVWANRACPEFDIREDFNIQYYPPGGGFKRWHYEQNFVPDERTGADYTMKRHLVFMTYLNDVKDEGETEFFYQRRFVEPRKGLTLIWPGGWMHTHRGIPSPSQEKYIITGWISYV